MMNQKEHVFQGHFITDEEFKSLQPKNVFHKQLDKVTIDTSAHQDCHILFRRGFGLAGHPQEATLWITADDYYKLYINGEFVTQGPSPSYHFHFGYRAVDVKPYLRPGLNVIAVHTLYQGLINRVWQSGDERHGLLLDLEIDGDVVLSSDEEFLTHRHTAYIPTGTTGYQTQFLETYDSRAAECDFASPYFDDSSWEHAVIKENDDHILVPQETKALTFDTVFPKDIKRVGNRLIVDFGATYVGYLAAEAIGMEGEKLTIRCGQELNEVGSVRYQLRANCVYEEDWILSGSYDTLDWFDYKSFRYAEILLPASFVHFDSIRLTARHYPFELKAALAPVFKGDADAEKVWELAVNSLRYGVQEVIMDCMEREKGFYLGDGCFTTLAYLVLTGDDSMLKKMARDFFSTTFITGAGVTCMDCSLMQEIAEYPMILVFLILWHYRLTGDRAFLEECYPKVTSLLDSYRADYEKDGLLGHLDKWCVVDWPKNFQDGYDVDITEGKVCEEPHVAMNAYYLKAVKTANQMAEILGKSAYRDENMLGNAFYQAFYDEKRHLFRDSAVTEHTSYIGNALAYGYGLCPDAECEKTIEDMIRTRTVSDLSFFGSFAVMRGLAARGETDLLKDMIHAPGAWLRMLREGATTTFEGWGRDTKWNTSLFHLAMSYVATFLADIDLKSLFS